MRDSSQNRLPWTRHFSVRRGLFVAAILLAVVVGARLMLPPTVATVTATRAELVQTVVASGRVRSASRAQLGSAITGSVRAVLVREGDTVAANQPLVIIEDREARAQLAQAQAALARAEAGRDALGSVQSTVASARARSSEIAFVTAERSFDRVRRLVDAGARPTEDLDNAREALEAARAQRDITQAQLAAATAAGTDVRTADALVAEARASVAAATAKVANTRVTAPGPGQVLTRSVEPGDAVQAGRVLLTVALDGPTQLVAVPDEKDVARLMPGQAAVASADAYPTQTFPARVSFVAPAIDPSQGTIEARLDVDRPPPYLIPDMTVSIEIETGREAAALVIPLEAVQDATAKEPWVLAVRRGRIERQEVELGLRGSEFVQVRSGLEEGDRVVVPPYRGRGPGDRVRPR